MNNYPEVSIVHLQRAGEFAMNIPVSQGFANLVAHGPQDFVRDYAAASAATVKKWFLGPSLPG